VDWLPTLCAITGVEINVADFDGEDASATWLGRSIHVRTKPLFWKTSSPGSEAYIREGQWKLRYPTRKNGGETELYDLDADPAESTNIAAQYPVITGKLTTQVAAWVSTLPTEYVKTKDKED
jgi:N-acetylgalactosamine-6-sulfatase